MKTAAQIAESLHSERTKLKSWLDEHKLADGQLDLDAEGVKKFREWNADLATMNGELKDAQDIEAGAADNDRQLKELGAPRPRLAGGEQPGTATDREVKSLGEMFVESAAFKASQHLVAGASGPAFEIDLEKMYGKKAVARGLVELKTLFDTASSFAIQNVRLPQPITPGEQQPTIASLMPQGRTSGNAIAYMEETTTTNNAAETAESGTKPEAALAFTEKTSAVR